MQENPSDIIYLTSPPVSPSPSRRGGEKEGGASAPLRRPVKLSSLSKGRDYREGFNPEVLPSEASGEMPGGAIRAV